ncbi:MAG: DUF2249 domain-containing protein [Ignavibacteriaceae bacterium]
MITKDMKISKMLAGFPQTLEVLINSSPHFSKLNSKILRKTLAGRVNVEQAAGIAGVNLADLMYELNRSINNDLIPPLKKIEENMQDNKEPNEKPEILNNVNPGNIVTLDVRPIIDSGKDPFLEIMGVVKQLKDDSVFQLINSFEPFPLYSVLGNKGYNHWTEKLDDAFNVFFFKNDKSRDITEEKWKAKEHTEYNFEKIIELDVRELVPPEPMIKILENLSHLDENTVMVVHHHREPLMLYPKLEERGFTAVSNMIEENYCKVVITKKMNTSE